MDVRFPDGTVVRAFALSERKEKDPERDYGLYLDAGWRPTWQADVVAWEDYAAEANHDRERWGASEGPGGSNRV